MGDNGFFFTMGDRGAFLGVAGIEKAFRFLCALDGGVGMRDSGALNATQ